MTGLLWGLFPFLFWAWLLAPGTLRPLNPDPDKEHDDRYDPQA